MSKTATQTIVLEPLSSSQAPFEVLSSEPTPAAAQRIFHQQPFHSLTQSRKAIILVLIVTCNFIQMTSNIIGLTAGLSISASLGVTPGPGKANWLAAAYALTQGTFVLVSGRLGTVYGHTNILLIGGLWFLVFTTINGFISSFAGFVLVRALSGIGGALIMPNVVALIGITVPPGKLRNISLGIFSASAPTGAYIGALIAGAFHQIGAWKWLFFMLKVLMFCGGIAIAPVLGALWFLVPPEEPVDRNGKIDWIGASLGTSGLIIFNVAWNQAPAVGWSTPYEIALVIISVLLLAAFIHWEAKVAKCPIVPLDVWKAPSFLPLLGATLLSFMSFGTLLWYSVAWQQILRQWTPLQFAVGWTPFAISAPIGAFLGAWLVPRIPAQWILAIGATCVLISNLLLATMPVKQTYWAQMFPATMISAFCPDFVYVSAQIIASNSVSRSQQGVAASLIGTLNLYGNSLGLGFASTVESEVNRGEANPVKGYRAALYFGAGMAALALLVDVLFVRVKKDAREGWDEDDGLEGVSAEGVSTAREPQSGRTLGRGLNPEPRVQDSVEALL